MEQISNWNRRPLRKSQLHYAAMDACILIKIYDRMKEMFEAIVSLFFRILTIQGENIDSYTDNSTGEIKKRADSQEIEEEKKDEFTVVAIQGEEEKPKKEEKKQGEKPQKPKKPSHQFIADEKYKDFYEDPKNIKFLIDNMAYKLAKYMRNVGLDAEYLAEKDHNNLIELAKAEKRVIITRDTKFFDKKKEGIPCYLLKAHKTDQQFKEIIDFFKLKITKDEFLKRCVKCNDTNIVVISKEEARKNLNWKSDDYDLYDEFWRCDKCKQIYWEGTTFKNAKNRFKEFVEEDEPAKGKSDEDTDNPFEGAGAFADDN